MARGFDSKFVEAQQEEATRTHVLRPAMTPEERARTARLQALQLARARAVDDLSRATVAAHRLMLERTIEAIDGEAAALGRE